MFEIILLVGIIITIGVALFNRGAKLGAETARLQDNVKAFSEKYKVNVRWHTSVPHQFNEMLWVAYCPEPDNKRICYEIYHHVGIDRVLDEFDKNGTLYTSNYFQFFDLINYKNAEELKQFNENKKSGKF